MVIPYAYIYAYGTYHTRIVAMYAYGTKYAYGAKHKYSFFLTQSANGIDYWKKLLNTLRILLVTYD